MDGNLALVSKTVFYHNSVVTQTRFSYLRGAGVGAGDGRLLIIISPFDTELAGLLLVELFNLADRFPSNDVSYKVQVSMVNNKSYC